MMILKLFQISNDNCKRQMKLMFHLLMIIEKDK